MMDYEALRSRWIATLAAEGEVRRLGPARRQMLTSGSLAVLHHVQLSRLEGYRRVAKLMTWVAGMLLVPAALSLAARLAPEVMTSTGLRLPVSANVWLGWLIAAATVLAVRAAFAEWLARRRDVYHLLGDPQAPYGSSGGATGVS